MFPYFRSSAKTIARLLLIAVDAFCHRKLQGVWGTALDGLRARSVSGLALLTRKIFL
jgi:hypothetical protein